MMKILIIGDPSSIFLIQLVKNIKEMDSRITIDILAFSIYSENYTNNADNIIDLRRNKSKFKMIDYIYQIVYFIYKVIKLFTLTNKYDVLNIHYYNKSLNKYWRYLRKISSHKIITFWGSDFYKASDKVRLSYKKALNECDIITFTNDGMLNNVYEYYDNYKNKMKLCSFGLESLDWIKITTQKEIELFRNKNKIDSNKIVVTCGYAALPNHRHYEIIKSLEKVEKDILEKCIFLFPLGYGDKEYAKKVINKLNNTSLNILILDSFFTPKDIAVLRKISSIFINIMETDQFSGSMQEAIFANNIIITGKWLPYKILYDNEVYVEKVNNPDELSLKFEYTVKNIDILRNKTELNPNKIWNLSSWEKNTIKWLNLYNQLGNKNAI